MTIHFFKDLWKLLPENPAISKAIGHTSEKEIPNLSLDMIVIDVQNEYNTVLDTLYSVFPKVKFKGVISGYYKLNEGSQIKDAVEVFCKRRYEVNELPELDEKDAGFYFIKK